jgi:hypothetical protein
MTAVEVGVSSLATGIRPTRHLLRRALASQEDDPGHLEAVVAVAHELLVAAFEQRVETPVTLTVERFALLTSVRLRCSAVVELASDPFSTRERVLTALTIAFGRRANGSGGTDLWAEVPREH